MARGSFEVHTFLILLQAIQTEAFLNLQSCSESLIHEPRYLKFSRGSITLLSRSLRPADGQKMSILSSLHLVEDQH